MFQQRIEDNVAPDCSLCPRLTEYRRDNEKKFPDFYNGPVPSFGDRDGEIMIVGLAPGVKGANQTGRPFTGDYAGDLLYQTLERFNLSNGQFKSRADDGLTLNNTIITNAVRCVPPQNKTIAEEENNCRPFLIELVNSAPNLKVIMALGHIAHNNILTTFGYKRSQYKFGHGAMHHMDNGLTLIDSYHCSRYNTNTGRLTEEMFEDIFKKITDFIKK